MSSQERPVGTVVVRRCNDDDEEYRMVASRVNQGCTLEELDAILSTRNTDAATQNRRSLRVCVAPSGRIKSVALCNADRNMESAMSMIEVLDLAQQQEMSCEEAMAELIASLTPVDEREVVMRIGSSYRTDSEALRRIRESRGIRNDSDYALLLRARRE